MRFLAGYTGHTRRAYARDLQDYVGARGEANPDVLAARRATIDLYARDLAENRRLAPSTVARRPATLSGFYGYTVDEELIGRNPVARIRRPRPSTDSPTLGLDREQGVKLLGAAKEAGPAHTHWSHSCS